MGEVLFGVRAGSPEGPFEMGDNVCSKQQLFSTIVVF
jgi:hypothetical protein